MKEIDVINRKRCIIAFIVSVLIVISSFLGIIVIEVLPASDTSPITGLHNFRYYTVLSNLFMNACAVLCIPFEIDGLRKQNYHLPRWIVDFLYFGVVNMAITFFGCLIIIAPVNGYIKTFFENTNFFLHFICPILSLILFLFINVDHRIKPNRILISTLPIVLYAIVYVVNVYIIGEENGGWFDHYFVKQNYPLWQILVITFLTGIVAAIVLMYIHNSQHKKYKDMIKKFVEENKGQDIIEDIKKLAYKQKKQYIEGNIIVPTHIIDTMQKEYGNDYTNKELYKVYLDSYLDNNQ